MSLLHFLSQSVYPAIGLKIHNSNNNNNSGINGPLVSGPANRVLAYVLLSADRGERLSSQLKGVKSPSCCTNY